MAIYKCKMCGGTLEVQPGKSIAVCDSCGSRQTLPKLDDERRVNMFERANYFRRNGDFDKAEAIFDSIVAEDNTDAEAYWSLVLCKYGISYVEDPRSHKQMPTVNRAQYTPVQTDDNYLSAIKYADGYQREIYESEAKQIDSIQKGILAISRKEEPFDIFICYKDTDNAGERTKDSVIAQDLYNALTKEEYKVFFSRITLEGKLGSEYEPYIFAALNSAKVMLVVGTSKENLESVWVKNEWSRYLAIVKNDHNKVLIPVYADMSPYDMPDELSNLMAQDVSKIGFMQDLLHGIEKICGETKETPKVSASDNVVVSTNNSQVAPLLKRVSIFLEDGDWKSADEYCERVLDMDPENAEAYLGKLMAELHVKKEAELAERNKSFEDSSNYEKAIRYGDAALKDNLAKSIGIIKERNLYNEAVNKLSKAKNIAELKKIKECFEGLNGFGEARKQAEICQQKIDELEANGFGIDETTRKRRKVIATFLIILTICTLCVVLGIKVVVPEIVNLRQYNKALALYEDREYEEAIIAFTALDGYKDSINQIESCKTAIKDEQYNKAIQLLNDGDIISAYESFVSLDEYKDSNEKASSIYGQYKEEKLKAATVGETIFFGTYEQDDNVSNGKEDIEWQVLDKQGSKILVISDKSLDCQPYNEEYKVVTWETCTLRKWLNSDFLDTAFSSVEQMQILSTTVSADKNPEYDTDPGNDTTDKVFLLSINEAEKYFTSDEGRKCVPTDYAVSQGAYTKYGMTTCCWWLRSPSYFQNRAAHVSNGGEICYRGDYVDNGDGCVRPALWINLES